MKKFIPGRTYRVDEFVDRTWGPDHARTRALPPDTLFRYSRDPESGLGYFDQVIEPENPLVSSETAQKAVEELRERGMTYRQIARLGGVSVEAVHRSASGVGRIRASTQEAILTVAASTNGKGQDP
jgi:hypothetical protein